MNKKNLSLAKMASTAALTLFSLLLWSCTSTTSTIDSAGASGGIYNLSADAAERVMKESMVQQFAGKPLAKIEAPYSGYSATTQIALDSQTITVMAVGTPGGYSFQVQSSGTMPIGGSVKKENLLKSLHSLATTYAGT